MLSLGRPERADLLISPTPRPLALTTLDFCTICFISHPGWTLSSYGADKKREHPPAQPITPFLGLVMGTGVVLNRS